MEDPLMPQAPAPQLATLSLEDRLRRVEDQLAIYQVISSYGPAADSCHMEDLEKHCDQDSVYDLADIGAARGCQLSRPCLTRRSTWASSRTGLRTSPRFPT